MIMVLVLIAMVMFVTTLVLPALVCYYVTGRFNKEDLKKIYKLIFLEE